MFCIIEGRFYRGKAPDRPLPETPVPAGFLCSSILYSYITSGSTVVFCSCTFYDLLFICSFLFYDSFILTISIRS